MSHKTCRGQGVVGELIQAWISGHHGQVSSLENATTCAQLLLH